MKYFLGVLARKVSPIWILGGDTKEDLYANMTFDFDGEANSR